MSSSEKKGRKSISEAGEGKTFGSIEDLEDESGAEGGEQGDGGGEDAGTSTPGSGASDDSGGGTYEDRMGRMTFHLPRRLMDRLRNAVYWTPASVTLSGLARRALRKAVEEIEQQYNDGEPFPDRDEDLKGGRPTT
jgi:hypothetical protein